jgi:hypothetical protein
VVGYDATIPVKNAYSLFVGTVVVVNLPPLH